MNSTTADKIKMLKGSMRCFAYGLLSLIPLLGFPFAVAALWISGQVRASEKKHWNAARPYRISGVICAALGAIFWFAVISLIVFSAVSNSDGGGRGWDGSGGD